MISRKAYEIAEVISKECGLIKLELTSEQVMNWYEHLSDESSQQGNHRLSLHAKKEIIDLNGLGYCHMDITRKTGHTRATISRVLYDAYTDNLMTRVKRMQYFEALDGSISPYDTRSLEDVRGRIERNKEVEEDIHQINTSREDYINGKYKNLRDILNLE